MENLYFRKNDAIFSKGDEAKDMFIVKKGKVRIMSDDSIDAVELAVVKSGEFFGEMAIVEKTKRSATAYADTDVELISIDESSFLTFVSQNPSDTISLMKQVSGNLRKTTKKLKEASKTIAKLVDTEEEKLAKTSFWAKLKLIAKADMEASSPKGSVSADKHSFKEGDIVFYKWQKADCMYKVLKGEVSFFQNVDGTGESFATLGKGKVFGEMGVLENEPRNATAVAKTDLELKAITMGGNKMKDHIAELPEDALAILKNLSMSLRSTTKEYLDILKEISDIMNSDDYSGHGGIWAEMSNYANEYNKMMQYDYFGYSMNNFLF